VLRNSLSSNFRIEKNSSPMTNEPTANLKAKYDNDAVECDWITINISIQKRTINTVIFFDFHLTRLVCFFVYIFLPQSEF